MVTFNYIVTVFVLVYVLHELFVVWMESLNRKHLQEYSDTIPPQLEGFIDEEKHRQIIAYTLENSRFGINTRIFSEVLLLAIILSGFLPFIDRFPKEWNFNYILAGLFFFLIPGLIFYLVDLPIDYYHTFVIEEKYGFNKSTIKTWIADHVKAGIISLILYCGLLALVFWIINVSPGYWWFWAFLTVSFIQILLAVLYPVLIAPLFNKFEPLEDEGLSEKVKALMQKTGFRIKGIFQMDAGRRSSHTNAYFTGLGKTKRVVLFDTLLRSHPQEEILAVLGHEIGHYKKKHILKQIIFFEISMLAGFYVTSLLLDWEPLYKTFGFTVPHPYVGLFLIGVFWQKAGFFLKPFYMAMSRKFEREADSFASHLLQTGKPLATALKRMAADNLSNLDPHPFYVWFNYSHPPLVERIEALENAEMLPNL